MKRCLLVDWKPLQKLVDPEIFDTKLHHTVLLLHQADIFLVLIDNFSHFQILRMFVQVAAGTAGAVGALRVWKIGADGLLWWFLFEPLLCPWRELA